MTRLPPECLDRTRTPFRPGRASLPWLCVLLLLGNVLLPPSWLIAGAWLGGGAQTAFCGGSAGKRCARAG